MQINLNNFKAGAYEDISQSDLDKATEHYRAIIFDKYILNKHGANRWPAEKCRQVAEWCARYYLAGKRGTKPPRGLALWGNVGTGKTTVAQVIAGLFSFEYFEAIELAQEYAANGDAWLRNWCKEYDNAIIVLDDPGAEPKVKHFGAVFPTGAVIQRRYSTWQYTGVQTIFTGNCKAENRAELYGKRPADRLNEMCDEVICTWGSFRGGN